MKTIKKLIAGLILIFLVGCQIDNPSLLGDNKQTNTNLSGTWSLINVSGGFAGVNYTFQPSWIKWTFNETNNQLQVVNNNPLAAAFIHDGLQTGNYTFSTNIVATRCQTNFQSIDISNFTEACFSVTNDVLIIDANLGADGFQYKLVRNLECGTNNDYVIFGHFYGECGGERCIEKFKLTSSEIFEDTNDVYPSTNSESQPNYVQLSNDKFLLAQNLMTFFPPELLLEANTVIGMPDASDGGGLYIEYHFNGVHKKWLLDQFKTNVPSSYHVFMDKVNEKIRLIQ